MLDNKAYRIMRLSDGKFSTGGRSPAFTKEGKTWYETIHLKNHLAQFKYGKWEVYNECKLVTYDLVPSDEQSVLLVDVFDKQKQDAVIAKLQGIKWW